MNNERAWRVAIEICRILDRIRKDQLLSDFEALRFWALNADYNKWFEDPVGRIPGVGLITFQYLRMQAGVDTSMPDKRELEYLSKETGYSQIILCWAIWLKESGVLMGDWERLG